MPPENNNTNGITRKELKEDLRQLKEDLDKAFTTEIYNTKEIIKLLTKNQNRIQEDLYDKDKGLFVCCAKHRMSQQENIVSMEKRNSLLIKLVVGIILALLSSSGILYAIIKYSINNKP